MTTWSRAETGDRLLQLIRDDLASTDAPIDTATDLLVADAIDSLGVIAITAWMEDELGVTVDATDVVLDNFRTIDLMLDYLERRLGAVP